MLDVLFPRCLFATRKGFAGADNMYIALRERNFYVVVVQCIVHGFHDIALGKNLFSGVDPCQNLEVDAVVAEACKYNLYELDVVMALDCLHGVAYNLAGKGRVGAVSYTNGYNSELVSMIAREVLIVLGEELCVLKGDD